MGSPNFLLAHEGRHEAQGIVGSDSAQGALPTLIRRVLGDHCQFKLTPLKDVRIGSGRHIGLPGLARKALACALSARENGYDGAIVVVDQDRPDSDDRIVAFRQAQATADEASLRGAFGVAVREFDAWMLADPKALSLALGGAVNTPQNPEKNNDPKSTFHQLKSEFGVNSATSELYAQIARTISLDLLLQRCPLGFGKFHERLKRLAP